VSVPRVTIRPTRRTGSATPERIIEFSGAGGAGGLISIRQMDGGELRVEVYRCDDGVVVVRDARNAPKPARRQP
jgi:hypothetical protein